MSMKRKYKDRGAVKDHWESYAGYIGEQTDFALVRSRNLYTHFWATTVHRFIQDGRLAPGTSVLEVGCGWGRVIIGLKLFVPGLKITGIDLIPELLISAREAIEQELHEPVPLVAADAQRLPFGDNRFDVAISTRVFQYLADPVQAVRECARVVRPGGRVVVFLPNRLNPARIVYRSKLYTPFRKRSWFEEVGLQEISVGGIDFLPPHPRLSYRSRLLAFERLCQRTPLLKYFGGKAVVSGVVPE